MVKIVTESTADIPPDLVVDLGITVVPSYVVFGAETFREGVELSREAFYDKLATAREIPTTATPPPAVYEEAYRRLAAETDQIVSIHLAARLSGLYSAAAVAAENVPGVEIAVLDSEQVTMGYGWQVVAAAEAARRGATLAEIVDLVAGMKGRARVLASLDTLEFVYRGGRVSWVAALVGTLLRVKPIIEIYGGQVNLLERARTQARSLDRLLERIEGLGRLERAIVLHANAPDRAEAFADRLATLSPGWERRVHQAGVTIASHAGPGAIGVACVIEKG